jgi:deazaflavin-dependent oxidoreductase (nitroreductase family)
MSSDKLPEHKFRRPSSVEQLFNRLFGVLVGLGLGASHNYLLLVRGRKTGRFFSTPVNIIEFGGRRFLVAPRGETQWVRNARVAGEVYLKRGRTREQYRVSELGDDQKPEILKAYLDRFRTVVQRYFPLPAGSSAAAFLKFSAQYPVFELLERNR